MSTYSRRTVLQSCVAALTASAGCVSTGQNRDFTYNPTGAWQYRSHDARNTSQANVTVPSEATPVWDTGEEGVTPLVGNGTVYTVGSGVTALDTKTGEPRWEAPLDGSAEYAPALVDGTLIVASSKRITALDAASGDRRWQTRTSKSITGHVSGSAASQIVVVPVADERLQAFELATGNRVWRDPTYVPTQAAISEGTVYVSGAQRDSEQGVLRALSATDGRRIWSRSLDVLPEVPPIVTNDTLVIADGPTLALHDIDDGTRHSVLARFSSEITARPAIGNGTVFVSGGSDGLTAIGLTDGQPRWERTDVSVSADAGMAVGRNALVVSASSGLVAFELSDGRLRWKHEIEGFDVVVAPPPVLAECAVFYSSNESTGTVALGDIPSTSR